MKNVLIYTFIENIRSKVFISGLLVLLLMFILSALISAINYNFGDFFLTTLTFSMNLTEILMMVFAIFLPVIHMNIEKERGTAPVLIAKLKTPGHYFLGKYLGFMTIILSFIIVTALFSYITAFLQSAPYSVIKRMPLFSLTVFYTSACAMSLNLFVYSLLNSPVIASVISLMIVYFSVFLDAAKDLGTFGTNEFIKFFYSSIYYLFPKFEYFNMEGQIIYQKDISIVYLLLISAYALIFSGVLIRLAAYIFEKKGIN